MSFSVRDNGDLEVEYSEEELEELLESGDEEAIDKMFNGDPEETKEEPKAKPEEEPEPQPEADDKGDRDGAPPDAEQPTEEGAEKVILSRDGKHQIPYEVLETARSQLSQEREARESEKAQWEQEKADLLKAQRLNEELRKQLKANDLQPAALPEDVEITEDDLKSLDEYGAVGGVVRKMAAQNRHLKEQLSDNGTPHQPQKEEANPMQQQVDEALSANQSLTEWQTSDPDRWDFAVAIDEKLKDDPDFKNKPFAERFAEVERRTKAAFGDPIEPPGKETEKPAEPEKPDLAAKAAEKIREAEKNQHPQSLTDLGRPSAREKSLAERVEAMSEEEMLEFALDRDPDEIFDLLEG